MNTVKRALRRHHRQRLIAKTMRSYVLGAYPEASRLDLAKRRYNNRKVCSCWMCGNPRKWYGPTTKERQQLLQALREVSTGGPDRDIGAQISAVPRPAD